MTNILVESIRVIGNSFKEQICENVSFQSISDVVEIAAERKDKFPALIIRGPKLNEWLWERKYERIVTKNIGNATFQSEEYPDIYDVTFRMIIISEGNIEALQTLAKIINFFKRNVAIEIEGKTYNIRLTIPPEDNDDSNINDLVRLQGEFVIEGIEFYSLVSEGKLVENVNFQTKQIIKFFPSVIIEPEQKLYKIEEPEPEPIYKYHFISPTQIVRLEVHDV